LKKSLFKVGDELYQCDHKTATDQQENVPSDTSLGFLTKRVSKSMASRAVRAGQLNQQADSFVKNA